MLWLAATAPSRADTEGLIVLVTNSFDGASQVYVAAVAPGADFTPAGLAVDGAGNLYISDHGFDDYGGRILMAPGDGRKPIAIMDLLDRPSDIEISPDGRSLVIAEPDVKVVTRYFGVSIRLILAGNTVMRQPVAILSTDTGPYAVPLSGDGYFHFPDILAPPQQSAAVDLTIRNGGVTHHLAGVRLQTVNGELRGHTVVDVTITE